MNDPYNLQRFIDAQTSDYEIALKEIRQGRKRSHWMWYIFPQILGLGHSAMAQRYAITSLDEAIAYYQHPVLGKRLIEISKALLTLATNDATGIFGTPDDMKLRSCMTLFIMVPNADTVFGLVLKKYFNGIKDRATLEMISPKSNWNNRY